MPIDRFSWRVLTESINQIQTPNMFISDLIFSRRETHLADTIDIEIIKGGKKLAPFVTPIEGGVVVEKLGAYMQTIKTPRIRVKKPLTAQELIAEKFPSENVYVGGGDISQHQNKKLALEQLDLKNRILRTTEFMACKALTGKIIVNQDNLSFVLDFLLSESHKPVLTGTAVWGGTSANIIQNLRDWKRLILSGSGYNADTLVLGTSAADSFLADPEIKKALDNKNYNVGSLNLNGNTNYLGKILNLDVYEYEQKYTEGSEEKDMFDPKAAVMVSKQGRFKRHYGAIKDLKAGANVAMEFFSKSWEEEDPPVRWLLAESSPLPVVEEPDSLVSAIVK